MESTGCGRTLDARISSHALKPLTHQRISLSDIWQGIALKFLLQNKRYVTKETKRHGLAAQPKNFSVCGAACWWRNKPQRKGFPVRLSAHVPGVSSTTTTTMARVWIHKAVPAYSLARPKNYCKETNLFCDAAKITNERSCSLCQ